MSPRLPHGRAKAPTRRGMSRPSASWRRGHGKEDIRVINARPDGVDFRVQAGKEGIAVDRAPQGDRSRGTGGLGAQVPGHDAAGKGGIGGGGSDVAEEGADR